MMAPIEAHLSVLAVILIATLSVMLVNVDSREGDVMPVLLKKQPKFSTQCERLVIRYLLNEKETFGSLVANVKKFAGEKTFELLLDSLNGFLNYDSSYRLDRAYALRGIVFEKLERIDEAEISYTSSLLLNNHNKIARKNLIDLHISIGEPDKALLEVDKAIRIEGAKQEREYFLTVRKKIYEQKELDKEETNKANPFNGLASLPGYALVTGHPKAHSG